jgi:hypothetical protein
LNMISSTRIPWRTGQEREATKRQLYTPPLRKFKNRAKDFEPAALDVKRIAVEGGIGRKPPSISELHGNLD